MVYVRQLLDKINKNIQFLKQIYVGKEEDIYVIFLSLISHQHCLLLGPPGTAKSAILSTVAKMFDVPYFEYLLTKFTTPEEILGSVNIKTLREDGIITYNTDNKLPEAKIAFLDEVFKSSSAILNTLLTILNERKFYNGTKYQKVPLVSAFFASNEPPEAGEGLEAFYDRILYKHFTEYIKTELWENYLDQYIKIHSPSFPRELPKANFSAISHVFNNTEVDFSPIKKDLLRILKKVSDQNIEISDRTRGRTLFGIKANMIYNNRTKIIPRDLFPLKYMIPHNIEEKNIVEQILIDVIGKEEKILQQLKDLVPQIEGIIDEISKIDDINMIASYLTQLKRLKSKISPHRNSKSADIIEQINKIDLLLEDLNKIVEEKIKV